ncbi:terminase large subunit [Spirosoma sp. KNUC1025]|uniref:terminase large subunit n=1 Tax=Spirosoma sp. KNUC1025 TaxID=2894082 RepID=UPI0038645E0C|nr:terminase large subunit [Spirosoma sp. KNUC1025]
MTTYNPIAKQYEDDILSGKIPSGKLLRLAIERQRKDLKEGHKRNIWFDHEAGQRILDFAELINIAPETPIKLAPCQVWELYVFYGWKRNDGRRRFRTKYKSCARGNGKTPLESLAVLYHLTVDGPFKAEAYVSATKEDQAKIAFLDAKNMLEFSPELHDVLKASAETLYNPSRKSKFSFLTSNPKTADGTRPTYAIIDEFHEFENEDMPEKLETGLIKTSDPIMDIVTTRGKDKAGPCFQAEANFYIPIAKGILENDAVFVLIFSLDEEDIKEKDGKSKAAPWRNPANWFKANPMLGHLLRLDDMAEALKKATQRGAKALSAFKTLNLNMWVDAESAWIEDEVYQAGGREIELEDFKHKRCFGGLDLAKRDDFCSFALVFPREDCEEGKEEFDAFWWHFIPKNTVANRIDKGLASLLDWIEDGYIIETEGTVTDYNVIEEHIKELFIDFPMTAIGYDVHNIGNLATNLEEFGIEMLMVPQTINELSEPTKLLKYSLMEGRFNHGFDPVMRWQTANAVEISGNNECIRLTKDSKRAKGKIDGLIAAINALRVYQDDQKNNPANVYDERGFIEL